MNKKQIIIGLILGLLSNILSSLIYAYFISSYDILTTLELANKNGSLVSIISLGALPNLVYFFLFLRKNKDYIARGILMATIITAFTTLIVKFSL